MGGDAEPDAVSRLAAYLRQRHPHFRTAWYSGRLRISSAIDKSRFDYIKIGPYIRHLGPLNKPTTNQRLYRINSDGTQEDITARFWKR